MKKQIWLVTILSFVIIFGWNCSKDDSEESINNGKSKFPETFKVDVPSSFSSPTSEKSSQDDTLKGSDIYQHLRTFVYIGESAADIVEDIMFALSDNNINREMTFSFTGDDGREKTCVVLENIPFEDETYEFQLTMTDTDGSDALQIIWNTNPVKGTAIIQPYALDHTNNDVGALTMYRIDYSEDGSKGYEKHMEVSILDLRLPEGDVYAMDNLKMFVGKNGEEIEVFGNSNHPNAVLLNPSHKEGFDWAFAARCNEVKDISVAKLGLPPVDYTSTDEIFTTYAIKEVFKNEALTVWGKYIGVLFTQAEFDAIIDNYLIEAQAPAYFSDKGYLACGPNNVPTDIEGFTADFIDLSSLTSFVPKDVTELSISFNKIQESN